MKQTLMFICVFLSAQSSFAGDLEQEIQIVKDALNKREAKRIKHQNVLKELSSKARELNQKNIVVPNNELVFEQKPLQCVKKYFHWKTELDREHIKDCEFKYNIHDPSQVGGFYAAVQKMKDEGWTISESKLHKQLRLSDRVVLNYEHYRFIKLQEGSK